MSSEQTYRIPKGGDLEDWRIARWEAFTEKFGVPAELLPEFHAVASRIPNHWDVIRHIYAFNPPFGDDNEIIVCPAETPAAYAKMKNRTDGAGTCSVRDVKFIIEQVFQAWLKYLESKCAGAIAAEPPPAPPPKTDKPAEAVAPTDAEADAQVIREVGFSMSFFEIPGRSVECQTDEIRWFASRLRELRKMFDEPMARTLARQALTNEVLMRRCDDEMLTLSPNQESFQTIHVTKKKIEDSYQDQWTKLEEICPYIKGIHQKVTVTGTMAEMIDAYRAYKANGDNTLIDGVFTAFGIQIETRASKQAPDPNYRPGMVAAINEAKLAIWDPNFKRLLPDNVCKALDDGFRNAHKDMVDKGIIVLTDLEKEGPEGEWPDLFHPGHEAMAAAAQATAADGDGVDESKILPAHEVEIG
jgi:hypothetical protein